MKKRILVVEDRKDVLDQLVNWIKRIELDGDDELVIDQAMTKLEALEKIRYNSYHVAMLDIMLTDSKHDESGLEVQAKIAESKEGTQCVIMSASSDHMVPIKAFRGGILDYFDKSRDMDYPETWTSTVKKGLYLCKLPLWGTQLDLIHFLALPQKPAPFWDHRVQQATGVSIQDLPKIFDTMLTRYLPLLPPKDQDTVINVSDSGVFGEFWSKALGHPIYISLSPKNAAAIPPKSEYSVEIIQQREKGAVGLVVWNIVDGRLREHYDETVWDRRYLPNIDDE